MNNRTKKKREKQLLGELWQRHHESWVKHWSVACKHSRKHYEQERRRIFGWPNLMDIPVIKAVDRQELLGMLRGPIICISKKDIIDKEGILKLLLLPKRRRSRGHLPLSAV